MQKLTVDAIKDSREYERERDGFRRHIIEMKKRRRIRLGDLMSITFENTDTMRFQIQEMARIERLMSDEQIAHEVETYNQLIPEPGELSGTLFIEIDDQARLYEWLPKLVGIQRAVSIWLHDGSSVPSTPQDEERLTREETTTTVHYLKFRFAPEQIDVFAAGPVRVVVDDPNYKRGRRAHRGATFGAHRGPARTLTACMSASGGSNLSFRSRPRNIPMTPATTCTRPSTHTSSPPVGERSCRRASPSRSRRDARVSCCPAPASRSTTASPV
jgi:Protein of unknown function (DUF3501)